MINFNGVLAEDIDKVWGEVEPLLSNVLDKGNGEYLIEDLYRFVKERSLQLWICDDGTKIVGAGLTEVTQYPQVKVCLVRAWSADVGRAEWVGFLTFVEEWASSIGCDAIEIFGRPGWERVLPDYSKSIVILRKGIKHK